MTPPPAPPDTDAPGLADDGALSLILPRRQKVVLVMDLVESVRLMAADEAAVVQRWHAFVQHARAQVLPAHRGRHVKSLGDGLLAEFDSAPDAVQAAQQLHHYFDAANRTLRADQQLHLRAGLNAAQVYVDSIDIYGAGVNLAARVAGLAGPGETIVTTEVRDGLTRGLDASIEDMGECYLKHVAEPVRVWRVGAAGHQPQLLPERERPGVLLPTIAVIPFEEREQRPEHFAVGELIADAVIGLLSKSEHLRVISRLSSTAFRGRAHGPADIGQLLGAQFVLSGSYLSTAAASGGRLLVMAELADARSQQVVWSDRFPAEVGDLLQAQSECAYHIARAASMAMLHSEVEKSRSQPVASLSGYALQLGAINLMHRTQAADFGRAQALLQALIERHPRTPEVRAWLAKWYVLRVVKGMSDAPAADAQAALDACQRALDLAPEHPLALAVRGYALCQMFDDADSSRASLEAALAQAPSEMHAWMYQSVWSCHFGPEEQALPSALRARDLSPLDPHAYFMENILANAYVAARRYPEGIAAARRALGFERHHAPALRVLLVAQHEAGDAAGALATAARLRQLLPTLTLHSYRAMGNAGSGMRQRVLRALEACGVPEE